jgi:hypothetical protein
LNVVNASIEDTGNLVLRDVANKVVWQSFDYPSDTLLPGQIFDFPKTLTAWESQGDWSAGNYTFTWFNSTYLYAFWQIPYPWEIPQWEYWVATGFSQVYVTEGGDFRGKGEGGSESIGAARVLGHRMVRVTLDVDGNLRMYSWASANWTLEWAFEADDCAIHGYCGPYAICVASTCACPNGFDWVDATDRRLGCHRIDPPAYCAPNANDSFVPVLFADWRFNDLAHYSNVNLSYCMQMCLEACTCEAVIAAPPDPATNITTDCWHKLFAMLDGYPTDGRVSYLRVGGTLKPPSPSPLPLPALLPPVSAASHNSSKLTTILPATIAGAVLVLVLLGVSLCAVRKMRKNLDYKKLQEKWDGARGSLVRLTYKEILLVTGKFEDKIGEGGFGTVFRGVGGEDKSVAVKRLNKELSSHVEKEFTNEVEILGVIHHVHLVSLLGYCSEGGHRLLVYEYLENGSLDRVLFREKKLPVLEWKPRFAVALATARGLAYLHDDCKQRIIHCDVKPENILLDGMYVARVADFGLSRIKNRDQTEMRSKTNHIRGTLGYLAPEYWRPEGVTITNKVDVFSFGMLLLEIVSGRRNLRPSVSRIVEAPECLYFPSRAFAKVETDAFLELVDPALAGVVDPMEVKRALRVAFWCINDKPHVRPSMGEVVQMLQGLAPIVLPVPRPVFFDDVEMRINEEAEQTSSQDSRILSSATSYST